MERFFSVLFSSLVLLFGGSCQIDAAVINIDTSGRGWIESTAGANGNDDANNYIVGSAGSSGVFRNHFDFVIPNFEGTLSSAVLRLENNFGNFGYGSAHAGGTNTYTVSALGAYGSYGFNDIGTGSVYGSVEISGEGIVFLTLNSTAISDILNAKGRTFSLGGVSSGEASSPANVFDFGYSHFGTASSSQLILSTSPAVPEPSTLAIFCIGAGIAGLKARRRKQPV